MEILGIVDIKNHCTGENIKTIINVLNVDFNALNLSFGVCIISERENLKTHIFTTKHGKIKLILDTKTNKNIIEIYPFLSRNDSKKIIVDKLKSICNIWMSINSF